MKKTVLKNPYTLTFGRKPENLIGRNQEISEILECFQNDVPEYQVCMLTGLRGVGKTVCLTAIANELRQNKNWLVADLSSERNLIDALVAELAGQQGFLSLLKRAKLKLSAFGLGLELGTREQIKDNAVVLDKILAKLTEKGKRVLVTVDEVVPNKYIREFVSQFQIYIRKNYNVFLLMTGLHENIYDLQNTKTMTFLYRAPKIVLSSLNMRLVEANYKKVFDLSDKDAHAMATLSKGYPYAFQLLGYLCFKERKKCGDVLSEFDAYLSEYVYDKIWAELSSMDKKVLHAMAKSNNLKVNMIRRMLDMESGTFSVYRQRLLKKGILSVPEYGYLDFVLPRFKEYIEKMG